MAINLKPEQARKSEPPLASARASHADADALCIAAILKGDRQRFAELVERYQRLVYVVVRGYIADAHAAEDAAQEVFVTVFNNLASLREPGQFQGWLLQIARHSAARSGRKQDRRIDREALVTDAAAPEAETPRVSVLCKLEELPEPYRSTLTKKYVQEQSCKEIAVEEGVKIGTITSRLARGLEMLRTALK
ncbi:MAG TPA: sigma-70 family RNA polymerase sigma factor [Planctomycetota bacterium]|nr:sigma-70 family RNA polymerase sigma factor [Planctomycetota bacterium]